MSPLTLLLLLFTFTCASVQGGNTRNLQEVPTALPTFTPTQSPTTSPGANPVEDEFFYEDTPTAFPIPSPTTNPVPDRFNYFGDYYFDYGNDQAFCNREERRRLGVATGFTFQIVDFLRSIESECGTDAECIPDFVTNNTDISFTCASCFIDFISDVSFDCSFFCFGETDFGDFECIDCIESSGSFAEIEFENCIGADFIPDSEFNTCSEQLNAEEIIDLPQILQNIFESNCRNGGFSTLSGSKCMTSEAFLNFDVEEDCADCIGAHAICVNEFCSSQCLFGDLSECIGCVENSRCASDFDNCSGLNLYFRGNGYNFGNYYGFYNTGNYYGGNVVFDTIIAIFNDFFVNFIGEFINNFSILLFGE